MPRRGYEAQVFVGTKGSTAGTQLSEDVIDVDFNVEHERATTTSRGDGISIPKVHEHSVAISSEITFSMLYDETNAGQATCIARSEDADAMALLVKDYNSGNVLFDGDVNITYAFSAPLSDNSTIEFTCTPNKVSREFSFS